MDQSLNDFHAGQTVYWQDAKGRPNSGTVVYCDAKFVHVRPLRLDRLNQTSVPFLPERLFLIPQEGE